MHPEEKDLAYIWDMHKESKQISDFLINITFDDFIKSNLIRYAVERLLLIIGEAANHVSE